ncbi:hypothetical protein [Saccharothrix sp. HUAS TT1]|uniref:hypothetical protein n=1 Tax=unclassified Saccharothrix TaxID=2593673 RepID=UPI00345C4442
MPYAGPRGVRALLVDDVPWVPKPRGALMRELRSADSPPHSHIPAVPALWVGR